jgi:hypothetical protein
MFAGISLCTLFTYVSYEFSEKGGIVDSIYEKKRVVPGTGQ